MAKSKHICDYRVTGTQPHPTCACGNADPNWKPPPPAPSDWKPFTLTDADLAVHSGHKRKLLEAMRSGGWVSHEELVSATGTRNFTARITNLRDDHYIIVCRREPDNGGTWYQLQGRSDAPTTQRRKCPNCGHQF